MPSLELWLIPLVAPVATAAAVVLRTWIAHRTTRILARSRAQRLDTLLGGCTPDERERILRQIRRIKGTGS
jgi:hypothetical protein